MTLKIVYYFFIFASSSFALAAVKEETKWMPLKFSHQIKCSEIDLKTQKVASNDLHLNGKELPPGSFSVSATGVLTVKVQAKPGKNKLTFNMGSGDNGSPYCGEEYSFYAGANSMTIEVQDEKGIRLKRGAEVTLYLGGTGGFTVKKRTRQGRVKFENLDTDHQLGWAVGAWDGSRSGSEHVQRPEAKAVHVVKVRGMLPVKPGCEELEKDGIRPECWTFSDKDAVKIVPHEE